MLLIIVQLVATVKERFVITVAKNDIIFNILKKARTWIVAQGCMNSYIL